MSACGAREAYDQRGVAGVQMGEVGDLVGPERTADAGMLRPAVHAGLEEGAVDDQLAAALEQVEQARFALRPVERIGLLHRHPRHPPSLGGQRVTGAGQGLLLHEQLLARGLPFLRRHDRWRVHGGLWRIHGVLSYFAVGHEPILPRGPAVGVTSVTGFIVLRHRLGLPTRPRHQQIERDDVRDHQQRHVDDRDRVSGAQFPRHRGKVRPGRRDNSRG